MSRPPVSIGRRCTMRAIMISFAPNYPTIRFTPTMPNITARSPRCPSICGAPSSTATGTFSPVILRRLRVRPPHPARRRIAPRTMVAALDFDRLGLPASQRRLLALRNSGPSKLEIRNSECGFSFGSTEFRFSLFECRCRYRCRAANCYLQGIHAIGSVAAHARAGHRRA
jgi:hypothetical protein